MSPREPRLTVNDSSGTWDVLLEAGSFVYRARRCNTGWYRLRHRTIRNEITRAYEEWKRWFDATYPQIRVEPPTQEEIDRLLGEERSR